MHMVRVTHFRLLIVEHLLRGVRAHQGTYVSDALPLFDKVLAFPPRVPERGHEFTERIPYLLH
jgi:hypothetical protein